MGEDIHKSRLSRTTRLSISAKFTPTKAFNENVGGELWRPHEGEQLARLDDTFNIAENGLGLLGLAVLYGDGGALPAEVADFGVGQLCVIVTDHLFDIGHFAVTPAVLGRSVWRRGEGRRTRSLAGWGS
jgi:hypothetical protein